MKIISKFKDFYDCIQAYGHDDNCTYKRLQDTILIDNFKYPQIEELMQYPRTLHTHESCPDISINFLLYCGNLVPFLRARCKSNQYHSGDGKDFYLYDISDIDNLFSFICSEYGDKAKKHLELMFNAKSRNKDNRYSWTFKFFKYDVEGILGVGSNININDILINAEVPIAMLETKKKRHHLYVNTVIRSPKDREKCKLHTNVCLSDIQFYKFKQHLEVFTDIENYITQQLGGNSPVIIEVSNKSKITKHGFDLKTSFRKPKQKK